jgi:nicotinate phosphoribosyltransferase
MVPWAVEAYHPPEHHRLAAHLIDVARAVQMTIPCRKQVYRLVGKDNIPIADLLTREGVDEVPVPGGSYLCRHPADDKKQARVRPSAVVPLLQPVWVGCGYSGFCLTSTAVVSSAVNMRAAFTPLTELREFTRLQLASIREDHKRPLNATPYKVP